MDNAPHAAQRLPCSQSAVSGRRSAPAKRGQPSQTALLVALSVLRCGSHQGLPERSRAVAEQALHTARGGWRWLAALTRIAAGRWLLDLFERLTLPGLARHHCQRKAQLLRWLRQQPEPRRWLWVGVGCDAIGQALRAELDSVELLEYDQPALLALREPLAGHALPLQLPDDADTLLQQCAKAPSTLILEGVAMYLPARALIRLLRGLSRLPAPPRLLFSALDLPCAQGRGFARTHALTRRWLAARGEPFRWRLSPERMQRLLQRYGYRTDRLWSGDGYGEYLIDAATPTAAL